MLSRLGALFGSQRIGDLGRLEELVAGATARLAQKSTTGYCRTKAGLNVELLFKEKAFLDLIEICRWNGFALTLADMLLILEGFLRPTAEESGRLAPLDAWLLDFHARHIGQYVHPERSWDADRDEMRQRLARARLAPPIPAANVGFDSAKRIWDCLPVHPKLRLDDFELVQNCLRFGHVTFRQELERRVDPPAIVAALPDAAPPP